MTVKVNRATQTDLIEQTAQRPNVALEVVAVFVYPLWAHVVWGAHQGVCRSGLGAEEAPQAKVTQLDHSLRRNEHIGWLDVCGNKFQINF